MAEIIVTTMNDLPGYHVTQVYGEVFGLTVRATTANVLGARSRLNRVVFDGRRNSAPVNFVETRNRLIGPIFSFSVRGTF